MLRGRNVGAQYLERRDVKAMLAKIESLDEDSVVFKIKNHLLSDINSEVLNAVIDAFYKNTVCQALYLQNLGNAMHDEQIMKIIELLKYCSIHVDVNSVIETKAIIEPVITDPVIELSEHRDHLCEINSASINSPNAGDSNRTVGTEIPSRPQRNKKRLFLDSGSESLHTNVDHSSNTNKQHPTNSICHRCNRPINILTTQVINKNKSKCLCAPIWCVNLGECDNISTPTWNYFCEQLQYTNVTHLYVSEHLITLDLKNKMRDMIRNNRVKHHFHRDGINNLEIIQACTNMWWNPINGIKHQIQQKEEMKQLKIEEKRIKEQEELRKIRRSRQLDKSLLDPSHVEYWYYKYQESVENNDTSDQNTVDITGNSDTANTNTNVEKSKNPHYWKFECVCGETCSSYENYRYHPVGLMYECQQCAVWSHARCMFGSKVKESDLENMQDVLYCRKCQTKRRRNAEAV